MNKTINDPIDVFNEIWTLYNTRYGGFETKGIDWKNLYDVYRTKINENTSEDELFNVVASMLRHLNDPHIQVKMLNSKRHFYAGTIGNIIEDIGFENMKKLFSSRPAVDKYFKQELSMLNGFSFAWLEDGIGYIHFGEFGNYKKTEKTMEKIISYFSSSNGIILDIRRNIGGDDHVGKLIADCFADKKREYMITSTKNRLVHYCYADKKIWSIKPKKNIKYLNPVILLIDKTTFSAAENFALAMRELPHIKLVGDTTAGGFADADWIPVSCGWEVCIPVGVFTDKSGFCWEGIGIHPNYKVRTDPTKPINGADELVELSLSLIRNSKKE